MVESRRKLIMYLRGWVIHSRTIWWTLMDWVYALIALLFNVISECISTENCSKQKRKVFVLKNLSKISIFVFVHANIYNFRKPYEVERLFYTLYYIYIYVKKKYSVSLWFWARVSAEYRFHCILGMYIHKKLRSPIKYLYNIYFVFNKNKKIQLYREVRCNVSTLHTNRDVEI